MDWKGHGLSPAALAACLLVLLPSCFFPPWEDRYWAGDDTTGDDDTGCVDGATTSGLGGTTWVTICGGTYQMGSTEGSSNETPIHTVTVPTFEMLATEVTVTQYGQCPNPGDCSDPNTGGSCNWNAGGYEGHPVNCVDWQQAVDFCEWVGGRLPSESEWEYAARSGGQDIDYPWGDDEATCDYAVMDDDTHSSGCDTGRTWAVCGKSPDGDTDQGLCDMSGNVWEWVQDWYHSDYETPCCAPDDGSAWEDPSGSDRVVRGGGIGNGADFLRAAARAVYDPGDDFYVFGFRCAR